VQGELDELEREEFFRLKKVQGKKQRDMERRREEAAREAAARREIGDTNGRTDQGGSTGGAGNMLATGDEDELF
jgi:V-type H+-transporting ATPase subunit D